MTDEIDIFRAAKLMVFQHGDDAPIHTAMRADELLERGDIEGLAVWKRILRAVDELLMRERPEGTTVH
jgi:hypothetical protein